LFDEILEEENNYSESLDPPYDGNRMSRIGLCLN